MTNDDGRQHSHSSAFSESHRALCVWSLSSNTVYASQIRGTFPHSKMYHQGCQDSDSFECSPSFFVISVKLHNPPKEVKKIVFFFWNAKTIRNNNFTTTPHFGHVRFSDLFAVSEPSVFFLLGSKRCSRNTYHQTAWDSIQWQEFRSFKTPPCETVWR